MIGKCVTRGGVGANRPVPEKGAALVHINPHVVLRELDCKDEIEEILQVDAIQIDPDTLQLRFVYRRKLP